MNPTAEVKKKSSASGSLLELVLIVAVGFDSFNRRRSS